MSEPTPPPPPSEPAPAAPEGGSSNRTLMLILSYLGILALVPLLVEKDDAEVQWHAKHGIVLLVMWIALSIVFSIVSMVPVLGCAVAILGLLIPLAGLALHIYCIVKALNGERVMIPGISQYADKF